MAYQMSLAGELNKLEHCEAPGGDRDLGTMKQFLYSHTALAEYEKTVPGFSGWDYEYEGEGPVIERTDPRCL